MKAILKIFITLVIAFICFPLSFFLVKGQEPDSLAKKYNLPPSKRNNPDIKEVTNFKNTISKVLKEANRQNSNAPISLNEAQENRIKRSKITQQAVEKIRSKKNILQRINAQGFGLYKRRLYEEIAEVKKIIKQNSRKSDLVLLN